MIRTVMAVAGLLMILAGLAIAVGFEKRYRAEVTRSRQEHGFSDDADWLTHLTRDTGPGPGDRDGGSR